jgi:hypothetical protein
MTSLLANSQNDEEIYKLVIIDFVYKQKQPNIDYSQGLTIIVRDTPVYMNKLNANDFTRFIEKYNNLDRQTFKEFIDRNQVGIQFGKLKLPGNEIVMIKNEPKPNWQELIEKYPNWIHSIIELSNIGYNEEKNQALIYYGFDSGPGVGGGFYVIYEYNGRKWKCKKVIPSWAA